MRYACDVRPTLRLACIGVLTALPALGCTSVHGRRDIDYADPDTLATSVMYECISMHLYLVEDASPREVRVTQAPTCTPMNMDPYVMNYSVRRADGDHFFVWSDADAYATELVIPLDRRRDAELRRFGTEAEGAAPSHRFIKGERGIEAIEGKPTDRWTCWSHAPGAEALREATPPPPPPP
jgi:hypothetical protein